MNPSIAIRRSACLLAAAALAASGSVKADFTVTATNNATIQPGGPRTNGNPDPAKDPGKYFFNIEGSANTRFASFGVVDFQAPTGTTVAGVSGLTLTLTESDAGFTLPGTLNFYLTSDTATSINPGTSPLAYNAAAAPEGLDGQLATQFLIGSGTFTSTGSGNTGNKDVYTLTSLSAAAKTYLVGQVNAGGTIRLIVTPTSDTVAATFAGFSTTIANGAPVLTVATTTAVPEPASLALLGLGGLGAIRLVRRRAGSVA